MSKMKGASLEQAMPKPTKSEDDYETEDNMRTMHQAARIASDPKKLQKVHKLAGRRHKALTGMIEPMMKSSAVRSTDDLRKISNKKAMDDDGDEGEF